ncbi:MAG: TetR family transcriptional regulator [Chitinophagaceae bacterium]|nr:MAG: TetR family transcriptional regulator [Chitinophagaceae bacterium]
MQELNAEVLAKYRVETLFLPFSQEVFPMAKFNIFQVSLELMNHFLFGITTPKGQKLITKYKQAKKTSI